MLALPGRAARQAMVVMALLHQLQAHRSLTPVVVAGQSTVLQARKQQVVQVAAVMAAHLLLGTEQTVQQIRVAAAVEILIF